jgi:hypothetical protein
MTPEQFFANPPWSGGHGGIRMGLRPIATDAWLTEPLTDDEREAKLALLRDRRDRVLRTRPGSEPGQQLALDAIAEVVARSAEPKDAPIEAAALLAPDDLCLMQQLDSRYVLTAACVCAPSYWTLADKIGRPLDEIHARVPSLNQRIGPQMQRFFEALPASQVFERRNWSIHPTEEHFQPDYDSWARTATFDRLFVRSERQTLKRLSADTIVFTIRVTTVPLIEIQRFPSAAADLALAFARMQPIDRENVSFERYAAVLETILANA